jgi:type IV pilus assembly protein PilM
VDDDRRHDLDAAAGAPEPADAVEPAPQPDAAPAEPSAPVEFDFLTAPFAETGVDESDDAAAAPAPALVLPSPLPTARLASVPSLADDEPEPQPVALVPPVSAPQPQPQAEMAADPAPLPVVTEPVAEAPLEELPEPAVEAAPDAPSVPFWKKELSLGKKAAAKPAPAPKARAERRPRRRPVAPAVAPAAAEQPVPFWKKELGRKKAPAAPAAVAVEAAETAETAAPAAPAAAVPFWKKELSLGKKSADRPRPPKRERPARGRRETVAAAPEPAAAEAPAVVDAPAEQRVPFYRRELGGKKKTAQGPAEPRARRSLPKPRRARAEAAPEAPERVPDEPKPERKPRRSVSLPARPTLSKPSKQGSKTSSSKRHKRVVGLKIGGSQIAAAHVVNNGHAELVKVAREPLEDGVVAGGELRDPDALVAALKDFFKKHKLPTRGVRLGIANNRIGVRTFEIVGIDDPKQLANAIRFRAQEALPIPIEEAVLDWRILSEGVDETGQTTRRVLLVVAYRELVDRYVDACNKAGVKLVGIDLEAFALLRALGDGAKRSSDEGALVAVSVGHERSTFAVSDGETCEFTRVLEWGGHLLNVTIARALEKTPAEVESVKLGLSLDSTPEELPEWVSAEAAEKVRQAVRSQLQSFARELVSSLQFYQNQPGSLGIGEVVLSGGTTQMPGFAEELGRLIGVRVRIGDPLARVKAPKRLGEDSMASLSVAIGLGIEA